MGDDKNSLSTSNQLEMVSSSSGCGSIIQDHREQALQVYHHVSAHAALSHLNLLYSHKM